jgi:hypothetical protein
MFDGFHMIYLIGAGLVPIVGLFIAALLVDAWEGKPEQPPQITRTANKGFEQPTFRKSSEIHISRQEIR